MSRLGTTTRPGKGARRLPTKGIRKGDYVRIKYDEDGRGKDIIDYEGTLVDKRMGGPGYMESYVELVDVVIFGLRGEVVGREKTKRLHDQRIVDCEITEKREYPIVESHENDATLQAPDAMAAAPVSSEPETAGMMMPVGGGMVAMMPVSGMPGMNGAMMGMSAGMPGMMGSGMMGGMLGMGNGMMSNGMGGMMANMPMMGNCLVGLGNGIGVGIPGSMGGMMGNMAAMSTMGSCIGGAMSNTSAGHMIGMMNNSGSMSSARRKRGPIGSEDVDRSRSPKRS